MIEIIGTELNQWDSGRCVKVTEASHVHFANQGDSKAVIMEIVDSQALIPNYLLQTGKQLCVYAVLNGVTIERKMFPVKKRERPENYVYDDDQRNYIYELITSVEEAVEDANLATQTANEAADKALQAANSWLMIGDAKGESVSFNEAMTQPFAGLRIFGKTTQAGTPTPDAPVELVSVGDSGSITVNVAGANEANSMTVATPNGLPGIKVSSGGNYIDANGQQWICDEIDFSRGVHIQRVAKKELDGSEVWSQSGNGEYFSIAYSYLGNTYGGKSCCSHFGYDSKGGINYFVSGTVGFAFFHALDSVSDWKAFLADQFTNGSPVTLIFPVAKPIETPLSEEELAAYAALHTYRGNTTVSNDSSAHMEIEYVMDAKKYIDSLVAGTGTGTGTGTIVPATVE